MKFAKLSNKDVVRIMIVMAFAAVLNACGGNVVKNILPGLSAPFRHLTASGLPGTHVYKAEAGTKAMALFQTAPAPSGLQQSFLGRCTVTADHNQSTSTSLVPMVVDLGDDHNCNGFFSSPNPDFGTSVSDAGAVSTLLVNAISQSVDPSTGSLHTTKNLKCKDLTNSSPVADNDIVSVYLRPSDNVILIFSGTTQLAPTCHVTVPPGEVIVEISASFLKS